MRNKRKVPVRKAHLLHHVRVGAATGLVLSGIFSVVMVANALFHGGSVQIRRGGEVPLFPLLPIYFLAGPITGAAYGLLLPLITRGRLLAYLAGVISSTPMFVALGYAFSGSIASFEGLGAAAVCSLTLGGGGGIIVREVAS
jgi:hypothetical protein